MVRLDLLDLPFEFGDPFWLAGGTKFDATPLPSAVVWRNVERQFARRAGVAELADALDSKSHVSTTADYTTLRFTLET